jgi:hypothetical protein
MFPQKRGPNGNRPPISRALFSISFGVPSKRALPPDVLSWSPSEREAPLLEPFIHLSKSPVYEPPSRFPSGAPMETTEITD